MLWHNNTIESVDPIVDKPFYRLSVKKKPVHPTFYLKVGVPSLGCVSFVNNGGIAYV